MSSPMPYVTSPGPFIKTIEHLRKSFPAQVTASTLKKLGFAPNNESYIINTLRFLNLIDEEGNKVDAGSRVFLEHDDAAFAKDFASVIQSAYKELFELHGDAAWKLDKSQLMTYFRKAGGSTETVGSRQTATFIILAELAGQRERSLSDGNGKNDLGIPKANRSPRSRSARKAIKEATAPQMAIDPKMRESRNDLGLTVRVEINLPATDDQAVYNKIFQSIRENLINV